MSTEYECVVISGFSVDRVGKSIRGPLAILNRAVPCGKPIDWPFEVYAHRVVSQFNPMKYTYQFSREYKTLQDAREAFNAVLAHYPSAISVREYNRRNTGARNMAEYTLAVR